MYIDFSGLFHQSSKDRSGRGSVKIPLDPSQWPAEWSVVSYKEYPRFEKVSLGASAEGEFFDVMKRRASQRDFTRRSFSKQQISTLLKYACGIVRKKGRAQPSGGGRYPIEAYPVVFAGTEAIPSGLYHYDVRNHRLDVLWQRPFMDDDIAALFTYPWAQQATIAIFLTAVFERNQGKYGERGYRQILIEAGAIVQNIYLAGAALGLKCCAIDGVREPNIEELLDVDGITESVVASLVLG